MSQKHTKGKWSVNHWSKCESGVSLMSTENGVKYFVGDAINEEYYQIVSEIDPLEHSLPGSFEGAHIAKISDSKNCRGGSESLANAKLIACAPEMLELLKLALEEPTINGYNQAVSWIERTKAVIEKATK